MRKAVYEDLKDIMEIIKKTVIEMKAYGNTQWDETYPREEDFKKDMDKGDLYVIEKDGKLAGFLCINKVQPEEYKPLNWSLEEEAMVVHRMAVNPDFRRMGIGTALMNFAEEKAREFGIRYMKTDTNSVNKNMNSLFEKCGYKHVGQMEFLGKPTPFNCLEKILKS